MANDEEKEKVINIILCSLFVIWLFVVFVLSPLVAAIVILDGDLDTLEPKAYESVQEQIKNEQMIQ